MATAGSNQFMQNTRVQWVPTQLVFGTPPIKANKQTNKQSINQSINQSILTVHMSKFYRIRLRFGFKVPAVASALCINQYSSINVQFDQLMFNSINECSVQSIIFNLINQWSNNIQQINIQFIQINVL